MKAIIAIIVVAVVGAGGALFYGNSPWKPAESRFPDNVLFSVARGDLTVTIIENGSLMAKNSEDVTFKGRGGGKITYLIEEGSTVEPNEVLCRIDATEFENRKQELELSVLRAETQLAEARANLTIQQSDNAAAIKKAEFALEKAQKELKKYEMGDAPKESANLEVAISEANTNYERAKKKYDDSQKLVEHEYITQSEVEQDRIEAERTEIKLASARRDLELFTEYTYPMTMREKEIAVADAQRELDNAELRAESRLRNAQTAVQSAESELEQLNKRLKELIEEIDNCVIKAPAPGLVLYGDPKRWWSRREVKIGGEIWGGRTLFTIPDLRVMQVRLRVHEADINKIAEELTATVTMDTYPGLVLRGTVTKVGKVADDSSPWNEDEVKKFTVDITLEPVEDVELRPGISAKAEVFVEKLEDVLYVPLQCVMIEEGQHYAFALIDGEAQRVEVEVAATNDAYVQVTNGLTEGQRVLLYNPYLNEASPDIAGPSNGGMPASAPGVVQP